MTKEEKENIFVLKGFYLCVYFALGGLMPLLSVYLSEVEGLNGYQIGTIMSISPIMMIFFQPLWGIVSDKTNAPTKVLMITSVLSGVFALGFVFFHDYYWFLLFAVLVAVFQSSIIPISDSLSLQYSSKVGYDYGNIRLYGSLGFGLAVFVIGWVAEMEPTSIFYAYCLFLLGAAFLAMKMPTENVKRPKQVLKGIKEVLAYKQFVLFLVITFLIFGPNLANNAYFGLFIEHSGGTYTGIGLAFLVAVLSEIPFMKVAGAWIYKLGLLQVVTVAGVISAIRWGIYVLEPSLSVIYMTAVLQGFSVGLFIPAGLRYIKKIAPIHIIATAVTLYSAVGNGLGNWFFTFVGGIIYEDFGVAMLYLFFAVLSLIGVALSFWLLKEDRRLNVVD